MSNEVTNLRDVLSASLVERDDEIEAMLLGLIAREHVLLVGAPGTAKSMLSNNLARGIGGARSFARLLTKFTTPEEVFGPVKLSALREDRYERAIEGYAADSEIVFLDEIWKASSAILNTLLTLLQERQFDNGGIRIDTPLRLAVAASNEWPSAEEGQELGAVFDRFLIRRVVRYVSPQGQDRLLYGHLPDVPPVASLDFIDRAAQQASLISVGVDARDAYATILDSLAAEGIVVGDRRKRKAVGIARAHAWLAGAQSGEVVPTDLECLGDVLWSAPEHAEKTVDIVSRIANPVGAALNELLREVDEVILAGGSPDPAAQNEAIKKLGECAKRAQSLHDQGGNSRAEKILHHINAEKLRLTAKALGLSAASAEAFIAEQGAK